MTLLRDGRPLPGALVEAMLVEDGEHGKAADAAAHPHRATSARTAADGSVTFTLESGRRWLIAAVDMRRVEGDPRADWESYWASLAVLAGPAPARGAE